MTSDEMRPVVTTQSMLAIEVANLALSQRAPDQQAAKNFEDSTCKVRAHYAEERGLRAPEVTLELLRQRQARHRRQQHKDA
jgi:hypothetical protein